MKTNEFSIKEFEEALKSKPKNLNIEYTFYDALKDSYEQLVKEVGEEKAKILVQLKARRI